MRSVDQKSAAYQKKTLNNLMKALSFRSARNHSNEKAKPFEGNGSWGIRVSWGRSRILQEKVDHWKERALGLKPLLIIGANWEARRENEQSYPPRQKIK